MDLDEHVNEKGEARIFFCPHSILSVSSCYLEYIFVYAMIQVKSKEFGESSGFEHWLLLL